MGAEGYTLGEAEDGVEGDLRLIMGSIRPVGGGGVPRRWFLHGGPSIDPTKIV